MSPFCDFFNEEDSDWQGSMLSTIFIREREYKMENGVELKLRFLKHP